MPSTEHESLVTLVCARSEVLIALLRGRCPVPGGDEVLAGSEALGVARPLHLRADAVRVLRRGERAVMGYIVEIQRRRDSRKRFSWPFYASSLRYRIRAPVTLVVITTSRAVATWARRPIPIGPGMAPFTPVVIGPDDFPVVDSLEEAIRAPELAALAVYARVATGTREGALRAADLAARAAAAQADPDRHLLCYELAIAALTKTLKREFDMLRSSYQPRDPQLRAAVAKGHAEGEALAKTADVLAVLEARGLAVTDEQRAKVQACTDLPTLDRWLRAAATCSDVAAVFAQ